MPMSTLAAQPQPGRWFRSLGTDTVRPAAAETSAGSMQAERPMPNREKSPSSEQAKRGSRYSAAICPSPRARRSASSED